MDKLLDAVAALVWLVPPAKIQLIANKIRQTDATRATGSLLGVVGTSAAAAVVDQLIDTWRTTNVAANELASMLMAAGHVFTKVVDQQSTELVWTGPTTSFVSTRQTEQALLQVINSAQERLFIISYVAYDIQTVTDALNEASHRGVVVCVLLEQSQAHGGKITVDALANMSMLVPAARLYAWSSVSDGSPKGSVHAKVAVADGTICFITSANLTNFAMERNMEAGVLIRGGQLPKSLHEHLDALVNTGIILPAKATQGAH